jgi:PKD repeat protein
MFEPAPRSRSILQNSALLTLLGILLASACTGAVHSLSPGASTAWHTPPHGPRSIRASGGSAALAAAQASLRSNDPATPSTPNATGPSGFGWENVSSQSSNAPAPRSYGRMMAWDPIDQYVVLFGGDGGSGYMSDTWTFHNGTWTQLHPKSAPSDRDHGTLAWDGADGYLLLFGGSGNSGTYTDTWKFLGGNWTQLSPSSHPSGRWASQMVYDASDGYVLLFGGCAGSAVNDTWTYVNGTWTERYPSVAPPELTDGSMAYDAALGEVILFGGQINWGTSVSSQTWAYHGGVWTLLHPTNSPAPRYEASMAYDPLAGRIVLFGGQSADGSTLGDTWYFAGNDWSTDTVPVSPPARYFGELSNESPNGSLLLFSGVGGFSTLDDTWEYYSLTTTLHASTVEGDAPLNVSFLGTTQGGSGESQLEWTFGDLTNASGVSAQHTYSSPGEYLVTVTATDPLGTTASASIYLRVEPTLQVFGSAVPGSGTAPLPVGLTSQIVGGTAPYGTLWELNGAVVSHANSTVVTLAAGNYSVSLQVNDSAGRSSSWTTQPPRPRSIR